MLVRLSAVSRLWTDVRRLSKDHALPVANMIRNQSADTMLVVRARYESWVGLAMAQMWGKLKVAGL